MAEQGELRLELKQRFQEFLEHDFGAKTRSGKYVDQLQEILKTFPVTKTVRLDVDLQGTLIGIMLGSFRKSHNIMNMIV